MLKYVVLAEILAKSKSDFLSGKEASVYKDDLDIIKVNQLKSGVAANDVEKIRDNVYHPGQTAQSDGRSSFQSSQR